MSGSFEGFEGRALRLLAGLRQHNERAWFVPRKARFERELLAPLEALVEDATVALRRAKIALGGDRKHSIFRLYRDVRFTADKTPYRPYLAAYLSYDGGRATQGGVYLHIEPRNSHLTLAFYRIPRPMLGRWRAAMAAHPAAFRRVLRALEHRGLQIDGPDRCDDALVRMPRGFEDCAADDLAPYFRLRSFCVPRPLDESRVASPALVEDIVTFARDTAPLLRYGWALD